MVFDKETLEFDKVIKNVASFAAMSSSKEAILSLEPTNDVALIQNELNETDEMRRFITSYSNLPFGGMNDIRKILIYCEKNMAVSSRDLLDIKNYIVGINSIKKCKNILLKYPLIMKYVEEFVDLNILGNKIGKCINDQALVVDSASATLAKIRVSIKTYENRLRSKLQEMLVSHAKELSESIIVIRDDRFCLAVKAEHKYSFKGVIHDESASKTTVYIEPYQTLEYANIINNSIKEEKEEIRRILAMLALEVNTYSEELRKNIDIATKLDILTAKAMYANTNDGIKPNINEKGIIRLKKASHPLIEKERVVPLDIEIGSKYQTIIITGPNTGGKTVSLKTVGLLTIMMQSGLLIPASEADMAVFDNVFVDIGDEQSIEQSLSTFSSHMTKIVNIVNRLTINSLILLDELGGGTDPTEGSSLAIALLKYFEERDARTIITTHYQDLKAFAYENDKAINASMEFSSKTLLPTYRLLLGISGKSNAFMISSHLGLDERIIKSANDILENNSSNESKLMKNIEERGNYLDELILKYEKLSDDANKLKVDYENKVDNLEKEKDKYLSAAKMKANKIYDDAKEEADSLIKDIESLLNENTKSHEIAKVKHQAKKMGIEEEENIPNYELKVNDFVKVIPYNCIGQIVKINKEKYSVKFGNLTSEFKLSDLKFSKEPIVPKTIIKKENKNQSIMPKKNGKMTLDLRGKRYEEAQTELEKFIDDALYSNINQVTIIHGFGTGAIRECVHSFLKKSPHIKEYRYGGEGEGLNGATIAYLK